MIRSTSAPPSSHATGSGHTSGTRAHGPGGCQHHGTESHCAHCAVRPYSACGALEHDELAKLEALSRSNCYAQRQQLFAQDEDAHSVYNITSGSVRLYRLLPDGRRQVVGFAIPGDFLGLSLAERTVYGAEALTSVTVCRFDREQFSSFVDEHPQLLRRLYDLANHELSLAQEQMVLIGRRTAEERVICFLVGLRKRWSHINNNSVTVPLPMTRQDIADFLGLTIETVSRAISKLARERALLVVPDGVRLLDVARLEAVAAG
ncbi:MAG: helix-turn-helix domain-containing protein [Rhodoblastus sp.]|nr:helix-turn-helix domain-containing protein [Rhodoblastus sp.]MCB1522571.1 helix-turn-helix domain-containing protein [Rhodoblastus sp.]